MNYDCSNSINKEEYIRSISLKCTEWARDTAVKQGFSDYCAVHDPLASLFSDCESNTGEMSLDKYIMEETEQNYNELIFGETTIDSTANKRKIEDVNHASNEQDHLDSGRRIRHRAALPLSV